MQVCMYGNPVKVNTLHKIFLHNAFNCILQLLHKFVKYKINIEVIQVHVYSMCLLNSLVYTLILLSQFSYLIDIVDVVQLYGQSDMRKILHTRQCEAKNVDAFGNHIDEALVSEFPKVFNTICVASICTSNSTSNSVSIYFRCYNRRMAIFHNMTGGVSH